MLPGVRSRLSTAGALVVLAIACGGYRSPAQKLHHDVYRFNDALRWGRLAQAAEFVARQRREAFLEERRKAAKTRRVLEVEVTAVRPAEGGRKAEVLVRTRWVGIASNVVQTTVERQRWVYGPLRRWHVEAVEEVQEE